MSNAEASPILTTPPSHDPIPEAPPRETTLKTSTATRVALSSGPAASMAEACKNKKKRKQPTQQEEPAHEVASGSDMPPPSGSGPLAPPPSPGLTVPPPTPASPSTVLAREALQFTNAALATNDMMGLTMNMDGPPPSYMMPNFYRDSTLTPIVSPSRNQAPAAFALPILPLPAPDIVMLPVPATAIAPTQPTQPTPTIHAPPPPPGRTVRAATDRANITPLATKTTSVSDRLEEDANDNSNTVGRFLARNPLEMYMDGPMPPIQDDTPASIFDFIDIGLVRKWEQQPGKLIVVPFDNEAQSEDTYEYTCNRILTSIAEITKSQDASVAAPRQSADAADKKQMPLSFLVYNLMSDQADLVLQRHVWSSRAITFHATRFGHSCPNFMFAISGLSTISVKAVHPIVKQVWESKSTQAFIQSLADQVLVEEIEQTRAELTNMLKSLSITRLDTKEAGNILKPRFNIYADSSNISYDILWSRLRTYLRNKPYTSSMECWGTTDKPNFICSNCHGVDHPRGLCPFPGLAGWNGPTKDTGELSTRRNRGTPRTVNRYQSPRLKLRS
ncbi:hypothetical protein EDB83DRAFT_2522707 [Lactarius deliciosus]|nr:hypothetical protein EDB83DRAFT_2522707 [Lactarius deliciosus]